jgi:hypothetical protein
MQRAGFSSLHGAAAGASGSGGSGAGAGPSAAPPPAADAAPPPGAAPPPPRPPLRLHPLTLQFGDAGLDAAYARHLAESQRAFDSSQLHAFHLFISVLHTGYAAHHATGNVLSRAGAALTLPYITTALAHWALSRTSVYARRRLAVLLCLEAAYATICTLSMPTWVLYAPPATWKQYSRDFLLGSGVLISAWWVHLGGVGPGSGALRGRGGATEGGARAGGPRRPLPLPPTHQPRRPPPPASPSRPPQTNPPRCTLFCVKPVFWVLYVTIPLEFLMQTLVLTRPVCAALTATPFGRAATDAVAASLDAATAAASHAAPDCPSRGGGPRGAGAGASCAALMVSWQALMCCVLLYGNYRLARAARVKFAREGGWGEVHDPWPPAPRAVRAAVHAVVLSQAAAALWAWLGCAPLVVSAAAGSGGGGGTLLGDGGAGEAAAAAAAAAASAAAAGGLAAG